MGDHLITEIAEIEAEADNIVRDAHRKAEKVIANVPNEISLAKATLENEYHQKFEKSKAKIIEFQKSEEERLKNEFELLKKRLLHVDGKSMEDAVNWVVKHIYES